jgi:hypothetical protein
MSELGRPFLHPDVRRLIEADRRAPDPPAAVKRRVAARVDRSLGLGGAMLASMSRLGLSAPPIADPPPSSAPPPAVWSGWKAALGVSIAAVIGGAAALSLANRAPAPASAPRADRLAFAAERAETPALGSTGASIGTAGAEQPFDRDIASKEFPAPRVAGSSAADAATTHAAPRRHRTSSRASTSVDTLAAERTLLDGAHAAILRRDVTGALAALRDHAQSFPRGQLSEERESMKVQALAFAHDPAAARAAGESFRRRFPRSMFLPAVEQALEAAR